MFAREEILTITYLTCLDEAFSVLEKSLHVKIQVFNHLYT